MFKVLKYFGTIILLLTLNGCYTIVSNSYNDQTEVYSEPVYIPVPYPEPIYIPVPAPPENPPVKFRNHDNRNSGNDQVRDKLRNSGDRKISGRKDR